MLLAITSLLGGAAVAEPARDRSHRYELSPPAEWQPVAAPPQGVLAGYEHGASRALAAVARVDYPNLDAWRSRNRNAYFAEIEDGIREAVLGYERVSMRGRTLTRLDVPVLDLTFRHRTGDRDEIVLMRFLFFRRYSLSLTIRTPAGEFRSHKRAWEQARTSFQPYIAD